MLDQDLSSEESLRMSTGLHEWGKARTVPGVRIGTILQEQFQELRVQGAYQVDLGSKKVPESCRGLIIKDFAD